MSKVALIETALEKLSPQELREVRAWLDDFLAGQLAGEVREFDQVFSGGRAGEPDGKTIARAVTRQKSFRKSRR